MAKTTSEPRAWAIVLRGQSTHQVPYLGPDQEGLLCWTREGDKEWHRVAYVKLELVNHPHERAPHFNDRRDAG